MQYECYQCHRRREATTPAESSAANSGNRVLCPECHDLARVKASLYHIPPDDEPMPYRKGRLPVAAERQQQMLSDRDGRVVRKSGPLS